MKYIILQYILNFITSWQFVCLLVFFTIKKPIEQLILNIKSVNYKNGKWLVKFREEFSKIENLIDCDYSNLKNITDFEFFINNEWKKINNVAKQKLRNLNIKEKDDNFVRKYERPLDYLEYRDCFSPKIYEAINILRRFKNEAVYYGYDNITIEDLNKYKAIIDKIIEAINEIQELPFTQLRSIDIIMRTLIVLIDSNKYNSITINEIKEHIKNENVLEFLISLDADNYILKDLKYIIESKVYFNLKTYYNQYLKSLCEAYSGNEARKWGIENFGLCLLLAWTNQLIMDGSGWYPTKNINTFN